MRKITSLDFGWKFLKADLPIEMAEEHAEHGETVTLPHTWNAEDGQDGGNDYHRGRCWYIRALNAKEISGDRLFLEVGAANHTAEVYINGELIKRHEGGYSTFRAELTERLRAENTLAISVDNSDSASVYPQKADFTFYGGLYRGVRLISVPEEHFDLEGDGGCGIRVTPALDLENDAATVTVETWQNADSVTVSICEQTQTVSSKDGYARAEFTIINPRLWEGLADPYLYTAKARLASSDEISARFGCRTFEYDSEQGFFLNGKSYPLRGVSRHQDLKGVGNALSYEDHCRDMNIIRELGANTLRLAHYQHAPEFYDLCDETGIVVWAEIPYITMQLPNGRDNTLNQMRELISQCYNHPSIAVWGLSNEITAASAVNETLLENHRALHKLCHEMDSTRKTVLANVFMLETESPLLEIADINSYNLYFGWYLGELSDADAFFDKYHKEYPNRIIGFSEYGADANPAYHSSAPEKGDYTEEYQALYHEHMLTMIDKRPYLWATHVWNLFDFGADGRDEGGKHGENQKGLVTFDRKLRKDAFYLYKAAWNHKEPFAHLCGKRYRDRPETETEIKVYSNQNKITLFVDGAPVATKTGERIFTFRIPLLGEHLIEARAETCGDKMCIRYVREPNEDYIFVKTTQIANWFDADDIDPGSYSVQDTLEEIRKNPQAAAVVNSMMERGAAERGDVAEAVKDNPALQRMMGRMTMISLLKQSGASEEEIRRLNRTLQGFRKEEAQ